MIAGAEPRRLGIRYSPLGEACVAAQSAGPSQQAPCRVASGMPEADGPHLQLSGRRCMPQAPAPQTRGRSKIRPSGTTASEIGDYAGPGALIEGLLGPAARALITARQWR